MTFRRALELLEAALNEWNQHLVAIDEEGENAWRIRGIAERQQRIRDAITLLGELAPQCGGNDEFLPEMVAGTVRSLAAVDFPEGVT